MNPGLSAFRFTAVEQYAIDIVDESVYFLRLRAGGWEVVPEFTRFSATAEDIAAAGGPVRFADLILAAVNALLRLFQGKPRPEDRPEPPTQSAQDAVLDDLNTSVISHTLMDGTIQLRRR